MIGKTRSLLLVFACLFGIQSLSAQTIINGYSKTLSGPEIDYHSAHPQATHALISRATDGSMTITWQTSPLPGRTDVDQYKIIWLAGLGCNLGQENFTLSVNGDSVLTFKTWNLEQWSVKGKVGITLKFISLLVDKFGDRMGIMELLVPAAKFAAGKPLQISVTGSRSGSQAWVMTFTHPLKNDVQVSLIPALIKKGDKLLQPARVIFTYLGKETPVQIAVGSQTLNVKAHYGINQFEIYLPQAKKNLNRTLILTSGEQKFVRKFQQKPVRKWVLYLVQHTHTDIGYTRPQQEILAEHLRYIDLALDYCDLTENFPDEAKFRWTCEATWPVKEYLLTRPPEQIERLKKRVLEGRIELTGMMFNISEIADENVLAAMLQPIKVINDYGLSAKTAMQNDVNGFAWALLEYFPEIGIKYVTMGENTHRALKPFAYPTPFWWKSPSGKKILTFRADHYMTGTFVSNPNGVLQSVEEDLFNYLRNLEKSGYPFDRIEVQYSGYFTDNSPPSTFSSEIIKKWNEKYVYPQLRAATISEFMEYVENNYANQIPEYQAAWPDWWIDGYGSAPRETAVTRETQANILATQSLLSLARLMGIQIPHNMLNTLPEIHEQLLFYAEHTFGAAESITEPLVKNSINQWMIKASFAWQAQWKTYLLLQKAFGLFIPMLDRSEKPTIYVFNPMNWKRSGLVTIYIDNQILKSDEPFDLVDSEGKAVSAQLKAKRPEGNYWTFWIEDVPALGWKSVEIRGTHKSRPELKTIDDTVLENSFYRIAVDPHTGTIKHLLDKELKKDLVDEKSQWKMGQFIYERLSDRHAMELYQLGEVKRSSLSDVKISGINQGPLWNSLIIEGQSAAAIDGHPIKIEIRLFNKEKRIDFIYTIRKKRVRDPEAIYLAFPFEVADGHIYFEAQGAIVRAGDQLPGTSNDWNAIQNFVTVRNTDFQIVVTTADCPIVQFGNINTGRYQNIAKPDHPHIYFWPLNNYWTTNFKDSQEGDLSWHISLTSSNDVSNEFATQFGWKTRLPMPALVLPQGKSKGKHINTLALPFNKQNIVMASLRPLKEEDAILVLLREVGGKETSLELGNVLHWYASDVFGNLGRSLKRVKFKPYESRFFVIKKAGGE